MHDILNAILLGIVEGITEFLPISSTGHLILVNNFIEFTGSFANTFDVVIQLGAILSVVVYFWNRIIPFGKHKTDEDKTAIWNIWKKTIIGVIPAIIIGAAIGKQIKAHLFNPYVVTAALIVGGIILILIERKRKNATINSISGLSYKTAFFIGIIQCLAMVPGTSRSAATIIGAMLLGASRLVAAEFSFFLAIPTMAAATGYSLLKTETSFTSHEIILLLIGFVVSFLIAWLVIAAFMNFITKRDFQPFGYYRIVLGVVVLCYFIFLR